MTKHEKKNILIIIIGILIMLLPTIHTILIQPPIQKLNELMIIYLIFMIIGFFVTFIGYLEWHDGDECSTIMESV